MPECKCAKCLCTFKQSPANLSRQRKIFGKTICKQCCAVQKANSLSKLMKARHSGPHDADVVQTQCPMCGRTRHVQYRAAKQARPCRSCAAQRAHKASRVYSERAKERRGDKQFAQAVSAGMLKLPDRKKRAAKAAAYWADPTKRAAVLAKRDCEEYKDAISKGLNHPDVRKKLSEAAKIHWRRMWAKPEFRLKMAKIRAMQSATISSLQRMLYAHLDDLGVTYMPEYNVGPWVFDCFLPDHNILIECQGDYWHSLPKAIRNDRAKATYISRYFPECRVLYLYEHDFVTKDYVRGFLCRELGQPATQIDFTFDAVSMRHISAGDVNEFMYKYHYIGPRNHAVHLGFYLAQKLIACCSYTGATRRETATRLGFDPGEIRELCRFCIHPQHHKANFASWCIARSIKWIKKHRPHWKCLVSFADPALGHRGTIYLASNWMYDGDTTPSYFYIKPDGYVMHKKTLYNKATNLKMTERQYAQKFGYAKKHTPPKHRFVMVLEG